MLKGKVLNPRSPHRTLLNLKDNTDKGAANKKEAVKISVFNKTQGEVKAISSSPEKSLNPVKTLRLQSPLAAAPSMIGEKTEEATPLDDLSQISKSLGLHDLTLDAPIEKAPAPAKESQHTSLVPNPGHKQIFPPLNLTVGKNPRYTF